MNNKKLINYNNFCNFKLNYKDNRIIMYSHINFIKESELKKIYFLCKENKIKMIKIKLNLYKKIIKNENLSFALGGPTYVFFEKNSLIKLFNILKNYKSIVSLYIIVDKKILNFKYVENLNIIFKKKNICENNFFYFFYFNFINNFFLNNILFKLIYFLKYYANIKSISKIL